MEMLIKMMMTTNLGNAIENKMDDNKSKVGRKL